ncbi:unnamed protein product [Owenia fusiformis]|uniref:mitogen-activated protein kinase kinase kinase n=1 Tax=Owenia fusiformis TaxID=6347 RepID=A0A8J1TCY5_OWEFU|nr:unnamed protein product [Owenia fusiformis]
MKVVCVIDLNGAAGGGATSSVRKQAYTDLQKACKSIKAELIHLQFEKLDFGETDTLDTFYNADVAVVDMSIVLQQTALFYHIGVRESMDMTDNFVLFHDTDTEITISLKLSCSSYHFLPYMMDDANTLIVQDINLIRKRESACVLPDSVKTLYSRIKKALNDIERDSSAHMKDKFLSDLRKVRASCKGEELAQKLENMRQRLDDPLLLSADVILNMLLSYRDNQNYDAMVRLVEDIHQLPNNKITKALGIQYWYAFALVRRKHKGDQEKGLNVILKAIEDSETPVPDMLCLVGRIYKNKFVESDYKDSESRDQAIYWYRKGFEVQPNEYAGINLATLLVISGKEFSKSTELQRVGLTLNNLIGRKGSLSSLKDYWDIATFFEISVLAEDWSKASQAAECMFELEPPIWYLTSTVGNIQLINSFRKFEGETSVEKQLFDFWMDFFVEATKGESTDVRFPVLIREPSKEYIPSYAQINIEDPDSDQPSAVRLWHVIQESETMKIHDWTFPASTIKSVSLYKRDSRAIFLYVQENSDDFEIYFSSEVQRQRLYDMVMDMIADQEGAVPDLDIEAISQTIEYEYELDEKGQKIVLGRGTYGTVYCARDLNTQIRVAVKEVPEKNLQEVQPLHEEIKLHSRLSHKNIVKYLDSVSEDGYFKIFMEQVPGGSLSQLLRSKWGPLKDNETTIAFYTRQILKGLKYLHDNKIVHRDIKGDNVLVNTYSGILKISDFGTSKRLSGLNPCAETFAGTLQYMAPEVIDKGARGYGPAADIWSLGCTVIEMATGKPPFIELGLPQAAMFKVGFYKIHPDIPPTMSDTAKNFLERCFVPDAEKRATAAELLEDPFLSETLAAESAARRKKRTKVSNDYGRSVSVPAERFLSPPGGDETDLKKRSPSLNVTINREISRDSSPVSSQATFSPPHSPNTLSPTRLQEFSHNDSFYSSTGSYRRSDSSTSETPMSPFNENEPPTPGTDLLNPEAANREGGFYLLRKDSERRVSLVKILADSLEMVCDRWLALLQKETNIVNPKLTKAHLVILVQGFQEYIRDHDKKSVVHAIDSLREAFDFDMTALNEISLAIYAFQDAVQDVLKKKTNQPHWIFAMDTIIRNCIETAITIISPELTPHLSTHAAEEHGTSSGVSTFDSGKSQHLQEQFNNLEARDLRTQLQTINEENTRLLRELIEVQYSYRDMMKSAIQEKRLNIEHLQVLGVPNPAPVSPNKEVNTSVDPGLMHWLKTAGADEETINRFIREAYTKKDVLEVMTQDDLRRLNLKGGIHCRIWQAIMKYRLQRSRQVTASPTLVTQQNTPSNRSTTSSTHSQSQTIKAQHSSHHHHVTKK